MNKYELAVVVSAKLEDDDRAATVEKVKNMITKHGGTITNVDEWGKKRLAYEVRKMKEAFSRFHGRFSLLRKVYSGFRHKLFDAFRPGRKQMPPVEHIRVSLFQDEA